MDYVTYELSKDEKISCIAKVGKNSTPVWRQIRWDTGDYASYIVHNGCGHCCAAMAAQLHGININPHEEYELCRALWARQRKRKTDTTSFYEYKWHIQNYGIF